MHSLRHWLLTGCVCEWTLQCRAMGMKGVFFGKEMTSEDVFQGWSWVAQSSAWQVDGPSIL